MFAVKSVTVVALKFITVSSVIPLNAFVPSVFTPDASVSVPLVIELFEQAFSNALVPIEQSDVAFIEIVEAFVAPLNALFPILVTPAPIVIVPTALVAEHVFSNALSPIVNALEPPT